MLLGSAPERGFSLDLDYLGMATHDLSDWRPSFLDEEVWGVVRSQELDKAPWFYLACWYIIKHDMMETFQAFRSGNCRGLHVANRPWLPCFPSMPMSWK
jgi:hypothetical protein